MWNAGIRMPDWVVTAFSSSGSVLWKSGFSRFAIANRPDAIAGVNCLSGYVLQDGREVMHSTNPRIVEMRLPQLRLDQPRCNRYALRSSLLSGRPGFIPVCTDIQSIAAPGLLHATPGFAIQECGRQCQNVATAQTRVPASKDPTPEPARPRCKHRSNEIRPDRNPVLRIQANS